MTFPIFNVTIHNRSKGKWNMTLAAPDRAVARRMGAQVASAVGGGVITAAAVDGIGYGTDRPVIIHGSKCWE